MRLLLGKKSQMLCLTKLRNYSVSIMEPGETIPIIQVRNIQVLFLCLSYDLGKPVKLNGRRLREQYLPDSSASYHARVTVDGTLAGSAFACRWKHDNKAVCWVTQLVVHRDYREHGLAAGILRSLRSDEDDVYGIISSHPVACLAAARSFGSKYAPDFVMRLLIL